MISDEDIQEKMRNLKFKDLKLLPELVVEGDTQNSRKLI